MGIICFVNVKCSSVIRCFQWLQVQLAPHLTSGKSGRLSIGTASISSSFNSMCVSSCLLVMKVLWSSALLSGREHHHRGIARMNLFRVSCSLKCRSTIVLMQLTALFCLYNSLCLIVIWFTSVYNGIRASDTCIA